MSPLLALLLLVSPGDDDTLWQRALAVEARDPQAAVDLLAQIPPSAPSAVRASYEQAAVTDRGLHALPAAEQLYRAHAQRFPTSPYAATALARADYLRLNMGEDPQALADFELVIDAWGRKPDPALFARMESLATRFPRSPIHARALFWLANARLATGDFDGALRFLRQLVADHPPPHEAARAELQEALVLERAGRYGEAIALDERYLASDDALARELGRTQLDVARAARRYSWIYRCGLALLGLLAAALTLGVVRHRAPLRPWPWEVKLFLPLAALLALVTVIENRRVGLAVGAIILGGTGLAVLSAAYLRRVRPAGLWRWSYFGAMVGAALSLAFCAVHALDLTELVVTTIEQGADR